VYLTFGESGAFVGSRAIIAASTPSTSARAHRRSHGCIAAARGGAVGGLSRIDFMPYADSVSAASMRRNRLSTILKPSAITSVRGVEKYGGTLNVCPVDSGMERMLPSWSKKAKASTACRSSSITG
jgi:hypothetical protein